MGGRTPGLISGCTQASSSGLTVPSCSRCEQRAGYRRFTLAMLEDIALSSYRSHWFPMGHLKSTYRELLVAAHRETGEYKIPS